MYRILLLWAWLWAIDLPAQTQAVTLNGPVRESLPLFSNVDFFRDSTSDMTITDVLRNEYVAWQALPRPMMGISSDSLWVRVLLHNSTSEALDILIEDRWPQTNSLDLFLVHNGQVIDEQKSGDHVPLGLRHIPYRYPVFDLRLPPGDSAIYLRYESNDLLSSRLVLSSDIAFNQTREVEKLVFGLLLGALLIMPFYNLMLYFLLKDSSYLYYTMYGLIYVSFQASANGLFFQYVIDVPWINDELAMISVYFAVYYVYRFLLIFLDLPQHMPRTARLIRVFENAALVCAGVTFVHYGSAIMIGFATNLIMVAWLLYTSFVMARRGHRPALFFLAAWILFMIGNNFTMAGYMGFMQDGPLTQWGMMIGSAVESVIVSIAMGYKFEEIRQALVVSEVEKSKLVGSMESARIIQESLVSRNVRSPSLEVASYYQSAEQTGGDWFSIVDRPDQHFAVFALGDVTGHGLSSSMMTAFACGALEASVHSLPWDAAHMEGSLGQLALTFNQLLFRTANSNDRLMTMSVFAIDLERLEGYYVNCGHHPSYLLTAEKLAPIFRRGSILGLKRDEGIFPIVRFSFKVGDTILLHSDGLVENTGPEGEQFPMHRVQTIINHQNKAGENLQALIESAEAVWKGHQPDDDVTVLMIRVVAAAQTQKPTPKQTA